MSRSSAVRTGWEAIRTAHGIRSKNILSRSNGSSFPFKKNCQPFERLELSVQKQLSAVQTALAIRSKEFASRSKANGLSCSHRKKALSTLRRWSRLYELCKLLVCLMNFVCLVSLNNLFKTYQKLKFKSA